PDIGALAVGNTVLVTTEAPSGMQVCADPEQLSRALHNLVRNAVQACDREAAPSVPGVVRIVAEREGGVGSGRVVIRVSDNGPG
ncbi:HAMP domain-containing histidine kinase, partial [Morganella morganii]